MLDANNLGTMKPAVPLLQYHGLLDEVIPYRVEAALHAQYCAMGVQSELTGYVGDHVLTRSRRRARWSAGSATGSPANRPSNC